MSPLLRNKDDFSKTLVISVFILLTSVLQCEGGSCHLPPGKPFSCSCVFGFYGDTCEIRSKCHYQPIVEGQKNMDNVDGANLTGLDTTLVDKCMNDCENLPGCRAIEVKNSTCSAYTIVPISIPDIAPLTSEKGRLFAIRRCFKKVTKKSSSPSGTEQPQQTKEAKVAENTDDKEKKTEVHQDQNAADAGTTSGGTEKIHTEL